MEQMPMDFESSKPQELGVDFEAEFQKTQDIDWILQKMKERSEFKEIQNDSEKMRYEAEALKQIMGTMGVEKHNQHYTADTRFMIAMQAERISEEDKRKREEYEDRFGSLQQ